MKSDEEGEMPKRKQSNGSLDLLRAALEFRPGVTYKSGELRAAFAELLDLGKKEGWIEFHTRKPAFVPPMAIQEGEPIQIIRVKRNGQQQIEQGPFVGWDKRKGVPRVLVQTKTGPRIYGGKFDSFVPAEGEDE